MRQPLKCFFAVLLSALIGCSHDAQAPAQAAPQIKVETRMVLVDVVVTDRKGEKIPGLHQEDFRIKEDVNPSVLSFAIASSFLRTGEPNEGKVWSSGASISLHRGFTDVVFFNQKPSA